MKRIQFTTLLCLLTLSVSRLSQAGPVTADGEKLLAFLDAMHLQKVDLIGSSLGTQVAIDFASRWPERVNRIVLSDPSLAIDDQAELLTA